MHKTLLYLFIFVLASFLVLSCSPEATGPVVYDRIVIDSYKTDISGDPETDLILFDETGTELGKDESPGPGRIDTEALGLSLSSGTYYIKVYNVNQNKTDAYVVRALSLSNGASLPPPELPLAMNEPDPYEDDDSAPGNIPTNPADISLGNSNWINRYLGYIPPDPNDVDWLKLVLP